MQSPHPPGYLPDQPVYNVQPGVYPPLDHNSSLAPQGYENDQMAITMQPGMAAPMAPGTIMMPVPPPIEGVPPGLEYLTMVDQIYVQQVREAATIR